MGFFNVGALPQEPVRYIILQDKISVVGEERKKSLKRSSSSSSLRLYLMHTSISLNFYYHLVSCSPLAMKYMAKYFSLRICFL